MPTPPNTTTLHPVLNGRLVVALIGFIFTIGQILIGAVVYEVHNMRQDLATIIAGQWTAKDQARYMAIHQQVHTDLPPKHVADLLIALRKDLQRLEDEVRETK